jgi:hypothetical protein
VQLSVKHVNSTLELFTGYSNAKGPRCKSASAGVDAGAFFLSVG